MEHLIVIGLGLLGVIGAVFSKLLADEFKAWAPSLVATIIAAAVRHLPPAKRERFAEEWEAHVDGVPGEIGKIAVACGCLTAAWKIAAGPFGASKRILDVVLATCLVVSTAPLIIVIFIALGASSSFHIFFRDARVGRHGKRFEVLRFRTMAVDASDRLQKYLAESPEAEREWNDTRRLQFDPRVTGIGRILRVSSLDELPQLFNVLKGDMSIVGPAPATEEDLKKLAAADDGYTVCKPGLMGIFRPGRDAKSIADYHRNWSLMLDVKIILSVIGEVMSAEGWDADWRRGLQRVVVATLAFVGAIALLNVIARFFGLS